MAPQNTLVNMAFIGDRVVDTAKSLGVYPSLMATALTPMIETNFPLTKQIECTACVMDRKHKAFVSVARKMGIKEILLEKSPDPELDPSTIAQTFEKEDFEVKIADFSKDIVAGILSTANVLDKEKIGQKIADKYQLELDQAQKELPENLGKRILVLLGMYQPGTGAEFLLVEEQGLFETKILKPTGCTNTGKWIKKSGGPHDNHDIRVITGLDGLAEASPDIIALTCEAAPGLKAIHQYLTKNSEASQIPAIANHAIFNLPHCCDGTPMALPHTIREWTKALEKS